MDTIPQPPGNPPPPRARHPRALPKPHWRLIDAWESGFATAADPLALVLWFQPEMTDPPAA